MAERRRAMEKGSKLVVVGCGGLGGPAAMFSKKLMPEVDVTVVREERRFIVR
jgi:D-arabinose 1-dehydrogenase-like Zn-dependent alcohol dehydrogenase